MAEIKVFISSVQSEFARERRLLCDYIRQDELLGKFFVPFIFEDLPAENRSAQDAYLTEAAESDIYIGLYGEKYGYEDEQGVSPTEHEYDAATANYRYRMVFVKQVDSRHEKEERFICKVEQQVVRHAFVDYNELRAAVYASLIRYMAEKELLRLFPFDVTLHPTATLEDLDVKRIERFVRLAKLKRNYKLSVEKNGVQGVLRSLNLVTATGRLTNSALLLFAKEPQQFFRPSEIKCAQFYGYTVEKPAPFYQVFEGDVFELIDQAVYFVMNHIDAWVGEHNTENNVRYELPVEAVHEAIANAVIHRDYTSNASVQVMLFRDRLEIWNPGRLPQGLTVEMLKQEHESNPVNPSLAYPAYLAGYIERLGTGTRDLVSECEAMGLKSPQYVEDVNFKTIIWRKNVTQNVTQNDSQNSLDKSLDNNVLQGIFEEHSNAEYVTQNVIQNVTQKPISKRQRKILSMVGDNMSISVEELAKANKVVPMTIKRELKKLHIQWEGPSKTGHWVINL